MTRPTILVTGATGSTGSAVVSQLLRREWPVRALVHRADARAARLRALGTDVVLGDLFQADRLAEALRGVGRAYFCPPTHPHMLDSAAMFAAAAQDAGLDSLVVLSQWLASSAHPSILTRHHYLADRLFARVAGMSVTTINPGFFADNYLQLIAFAAQLERLPNPFGDSRNAPPSNADIARVAVAALTDPDRHAGRTYRPTGPDLLDAAGMAAALTRVLDRPVRPMAMPELLFAKAMRAFGYSAFMTAQTRHYLAEHLRGTFAHGAPNDDVERATGRSAETFATSALGYAHRPDAARTPANLGRVLADLARTTVTPGGNPQQLADRQADPVPTRTRLAIDDPQWQRTHSATLAA